MRFYVHMSGDGIGTLSVFTISEGQTLLQMNLTGDQGNYWQMREVPLSSAQDFQVMFEGKVGRNPMGDICLDDITFSPGCLLASSAEIEPPPSAGMLLLNTLRSCPFLLKSNSEPVVRCAAKPRDNPVLL